jgi:acyl dehydratase
MPVPAKRVSGVVAGTAIPPWRMDRVSAEKMKLYAALARDPSPIHWDPEEVARRGLGHRVINQGPTSLGYVLNMLMAWTGPASIRRVVARFTDTVFADDAVEAGGIVTAVRDEGPERLADCDVWLDRDDGVRVVVASATVALTPNGDPP